VEVDGIIGMMAAGTRADRNGVLQMQSPSEFGAFKATINTMQKRLEEFPPQTPRFLREVPSGSITSWESLIAFGSVLRGVDI
jgi:hypothetical protein